MSNPGINNQEFKLVFDSNHFKKYDSILTEIYNTIKYVWYWLGFGIQYNMIVLEDPIMNTEGDFIYTVKMIKKELYWFKFKIYTFKQLK